MRTKIKDDFNWLLGLGILLVLVLGCVAILPVFLQSTHETRQGETSEVATQEIGWCKLIADPLPIAGERRMVLVEFSTGLHTTASAVVIPEAYPGGELWKSGYEIFVEVVTTYTARFEGAVSVRKPTATLIITDSRPPKN